MHTHLWAFPRGMQRDGMKESFQVVTTQLPNGNTAQLHLSLSDATGDSAILEYVGGKLHAGEVSASFVPAKPFTFLPVKLDRGAAVGARLSSAAPPCYTVVAPPPGGVR